MWRLPLFGRCSTDYNRFAARSACSANRVADIEAILAAKLPLDEEYIEQWATYWDVLTSWRSLR